MRSQIEIFLENIIQEFSIDTIDSNHLKFENIYPFSNESGFVEIIKHLKQIKPNPTEKIKVALLFGESNFLSLLPCLAEMADAVLLADINPHQHSHMRFLMECFNSANTPEQFVNNYLQNNPLFGKQIAHTHKKYDIAEMKEALAFSKDSSGKYYFLNNQSNFDACKQSLEKIKVSQINLDLGNASDCKKMNDFLIKNNAIFSLCNFTNIHHYVEMNKLETSVNQLLNHNEQGLIMYSAGPKTKLRTYCTIELKQYFLRANENSFDNFDEFLKEIKCKKNTFDNFFSKSELFFKKPVTKKNDGKIEVSYLAIACDEDTLNNIISGKECINEFSNSLHAHATLKETEDFCSNIQAKIPAKRGCFATYDFEDDNYWILKIRGNKDKINYLLRYSDKNNERTADHHNPSNFYKAQLKLPPLILEVINHDHSIKIDTKP